MWKVAFEPEYRESDTESLRCSLHIRSIALSIHEWFPLTNHRLSMSLMRMMPTEPEASLELVNKGGTASESPFASNGCEGRFFMTPTANQRELRKAYLVSVT